jgi:hypothetical protein
MYKKIFQDFLRKDFDNWMLLKGNDLKSSYDSGTVRLEYYNISSTDYFKSIHVRKLFTIRPDRVRFSSITGQGFLLPHRDHDADVVLNYYISANSDTTIFYKEKENSTPFKYKDKDKANIYSLDDTIEINRFVSNSGEAYLLNVSEIHAVEKVSQEPRLFISYIWKGFTYDEILKNIEGVSSGSI